MLVTAIIAAETDVCNPPHTILREEADNNGAAATKLDGSNNNYHLTQREGNLTPITT